MGAVFAWGVGVTDLSQASAPALTHGLRLTFGLAAVALALGLTLRPRG